MSESGSESGRSGWARHHRKQQLAWLSLTPAQRLAWLEQAKQFARAAQEAARERLEQARQRTGGGR